MAQPVYAEAGAVEVGVVAGGSGRRPSRSPLAGGEVPEAKRGPGELSAGEIAGRYGVSIQTARRLYQQGKVAYRRLPDGRVLVDVGTIPKDWAAKVKRRRLDNEAAREVARGRLPGAEFQRHLWWLEDRVEAVLAAAAEERTGLLDEAAAERAAARKEREGLLGIIERITGSGTP